MTLTLIGNADYWRGTCSCGEWKSRWRGDRKTVEAEARWHDDAPFGEHVVSIRRYARAAS